MNVKLLIDGIMHQTTVLIAQLSTVAGVRAPLAHVADQVFLSLSREIEAQGVARKVVADMFGLALRGYQRKTQRLAESASAQGKTLFEAVLDFIEKKGGANRAVILERFRHDGQRETIGVLTDLVQSGLLYCTGSGDSTLYGVTSDAERQRLTRHADRIALSNMALGEIYRNPGVGAALLAQRLQVELGELEPALDELLKDGRVDQDERTGALKANTFQIPVGASEGWESAVFDHFQAVSAAIVTKLRLRARGSSAAASMGGTTLRFELSPDHPLRDEVLSLLGRVRALTDELWTRVGEHNDAHPAPHDERFNVSFYFGQNVDDPTARRSGMQRKLPPRLRLRWHDLRQCVHRNGGRSRCRDRRRMRDVFRLREQRRLQRRRRLLQDRLRRARPVRGARGVLGRPRACLRLRRNDVRQRL